MLTSFTAFKDSDGKLHTTLEPAQKAERRIMFAALFDTAVHGNPQLARLDKALTVDLLMTLGKSIGDIANDRLAPSNGSVILEAAVTMQPIVDTARKVGELDRLAGPYRPTIAEQEARAREILRPMRDDAYPREKLNPETPAKKESGIQDSTVENSRPFGIPARPMDAAVSRAEGMEPKVWPKHPLDGGRQMAEGRALDEVLEREIEEGLRQAGGVSGRGY